MLRQNMYLLRIKLRILPYNRNRIILGTIVRNPQLLVLIGLNNDGIHQCFYEFASIKGTQYNCHQTTSHLLLSSIIFSRYRKDSRRKIAEPAT